MGKGLVAIILVFVLLAGLTLLSVGLGWVGGKGDNFLRRTIGKERATIEREVFEESKSYVKGMADDLSKYKLEWMKEKDNTVKRAIINHVNSVYADFDADTLHDDDLAEWLRDARKGEFY